MSNKEYDVFFPIKEVIISDRAGTILTEDESEMTGLEITGTGSLVISNTGGSSASEGGMGTGGGAEKGPGIQDPGGNKSSQQENTSSKSSDDEEWDPLKPKEEKEKGK